MKILILGGYGTFGSRLARLLIEEPNVKLIIAGRSIKQAEDFCQKLNSNRSSAVYLDRNEFDIEKQIASIRPNLLVDASGPFQLYENDPYRIVKMCINQSIDYIDLADGSRFVRDIRQFDQQAKQKNIFVLSGVSTCPVLTATVVRYLARDLKNIHSIKGGIAPSPRVDIGRNVIRAISSYAGKPMLKVQNGQLTTSYALTETMNYTISPPGYLPLTNRHFSLVDVPDHEILRDLWPNVDSIWFGAGPIPSSLHYLLNSLAWLVRCRIIPSLLPFTSIFHRTLNIVRWSGESHGGMFVSIEGTNKFDEKIDKSWHLIAKDDTGPFIPSMGIAAIVHRILNGKKPLSGARSAITDLDLDDYERLFNKYDIVTGQRQFKSTNTTDLTLFQRLLDQAWHQLPSSIQRMHSFKSITKVTGLATVERGTSIFSRLIGMIFRFPQSGTQIPVEVEFKPDVNGELWTRTFAGRSFASWLSEGRGRSDRLLNERFGPFTFGLAIVIKNKQLHLVVRNWNFLGIPLPNFLIPTGDSYEYDDDGRFCFHVEIKHISTGLIIKYKGWLELVSTNK